MSASVEAERALLGAMMLDRDAVWRVRGMVSAEDFHNPAHGAAYEVICRQADEGGDTDSITVHEAASRAGQKVPEMHELGAMAREGSSIASAPSYAQVVRARARCRQAIVAVAEVRPRLDSGDSDAIAEVQARLEGLSHTTGGYKTFSQVLREGLKSIETAMDRRFNGIIGCPTGLAALDDMTGGWHGPKLIILAGRPSLGKTALAMQGARAAAAAGKPVGIMSLEMGADELAIRAMAAEYRLNGSALAFGDEQSIADLQVHAQRRNIKDLPIFVDEDTFSVGGIIARLTEWHRKHGIKLAIIDHLQLIDTHLGGGRSRNDALGEVTRALKLTAKRLDMPIILLSQLTRANEKENRQPRLSDLRDSGNIEQDADIVLAMHGQLDAPDEGRREVSLGFLKHRGGRVGWLPRAMHFNGPHQVFEENPHDF